MQPIFTDWRPEDAGRLGRETMHLGHSLAETGLFTDEALARLIEQTPRQDYHVSTMDPNSHDPRSRREGVIKGLDGSAVLEAIGKGHIWLNLRNPGAYVPAYQSLLDAIYAELETRIPGLRTFKQKMTILVSSPSVRVGYHSDVPGQTLWQVRGRKRVWLYPLGDPFLSQEALERIIMGEAHEVSLAYEPSFDSRAEVIDLEPGRMLTWPLNAPHRVVNHDCLNVSVTTEHWTPELRNAYGVKYANGILRSRLGLKRLSLASEGLGVYPKLGLTAAWKLSGMQKRRRHRTRIDFCVDPKAAGGFRDIPAHELPA
jgi:hypothetical protein